jgi:RimJ/RimL family protein N-acetyltransferase
VGDLVLETSRLRLRLYRLEDLDALQEILGDPWTMRFYPAPFDRDGCRAWIEQQLDRYETDGFGLWAMELRDTGQFVGNCGPVARLIEGRPEVELGWHVHRSLQRQGLATEAAVACRDHAFDRLGLQRLTALVRPVNSPSRRVAEKTGMEVEREVSHAAMPHLLYVVETGQERRATTTMLGDSSVSGSPA